MLVLKCSGLIKYIGMCSKLINSPPKVSPCPNAWNLWIWPYLGKKKGLCQCNWECWCETILDLMRVLKLTRQTWVWVGSGSWWWTGKLGMLQSMGSQRARHNWVTELNWTETQWEIVLPRERQRKIAGEKTREDRGRDWSYIAANQGTPGAKTWMNHSGILL